MDLANNYFNYENLPLKQKILTKLINQNILKQILIILN